MKKYIVTHQACGAKFSNGYIISDNYNHSLSSYLLMAEEAIGHFRDLDYSAINCGIVTESRWCKSCSIIQFPLPNDTRHEGFTAVDDKLPDVEWS